jgi:hypothetical protein
MFILCLIQNSAWILSWNKKARDRNKIDMNKKGINQIIHIW